jgi:phage terminase large subunit-like protein
MEPVDRLSLPTRARLRLIRRRRARLAEPLLDFVPRVSAHYSAPRHLRTFAEALEEAIRKEVFLLVSMPPQHGKTMLAMHALIWHMLRRARRHMYLTYSQERARIVQSEAKIIAGNAGLEISGTQSFWRLANGAQIRWAGIGVGVGGTPADGLIFVDDPYAGMTEAQSKVTREHVDTWFRSVVIARRHLGSSIVVLSTRWHPNDLIGELAREASLPWQVINYPAIDDGGNALWPEKQPLALLEQKRVTAGPFIWEAEFQGRPRPRGLQVFRDVHYGLVPRARSVRRAIGVDLAYTDKSYADYSTAVVLAALDDVDEKTGRPVTTFYVERVVRLQVQATDFAAALRGLQAMYPGVPMFSYIGGTEKGTVQLMNRAGPRGEPPVNLRAKVLSGAGDKFLRAQPISAAWNAGRVMLPDVDTLLRSADPVDRTHGAHARTWLPAFAEELLSFTGDGDKNDDQVDALVNAHALLARRVVVDFSSLPGSI